MPNYLARCTYLNEARSCHTWRVIDDRRQECTHCHRIIGIPRRKTGKRVAVQRPIQTERIYRILRGLCPHNKLYVLSSSLGADIANILYELRYSRGWSAYTIAWKSGVSEERLAKYVYKYDWYPGKTW